MESHNAFQNLERSISQTFFVGDVASTASARGAHHRTFVVLNSNSSGASIMTLQTTRTAVRGELIEPVSQQLGVETRGSILDRFQLRRMDRASERNSRRAFLQGQLACLKDSINTEIATNREVCRANFEQIRILFRENVDRAKNETEAKLARQASELLVEAAREFDELISAVEQVANDNIKKHLVCALEQRIERLAAYLTRPY
ncbi:MAG: hypothetical protein KDB27_15710 [Planctomycetales bacterium]|nr:hypothetical protein [Planctomycetales bacterium]